MVEDKNKNFIKNARLMQAIFIGIFTLGLAMAGGDVTSAVKFPISAFSITTMMFGVFGYLICEWLIRKAVKW